MNALMRNLFVNRTYGAGTKMLAGVARAARGIFERTRAAVRILRAVPLSVLRARLLLALAIVAISVFWGMATAFLELNAVILVAAIIAAIFILIDYRIGVIL